MDERHTAAVGTTTGLFINHADALVHEHFYGGFDIIHF